MSGYRGSWHYLNKVSALDWADGLRNNRLNRQAQVQQQIQQNQLAEYNAHERCRILEEEVLKMRSELHDMKEKERLQQLHDKNLATWQVRMARWTMWASGLFAASLRLNIPLNYPLELSQPLTTSDINMPKFVNMLNERFYNKPEVESRKRLRQHIYKKLRSPSKNFWRDISRVAVLEAGAPFGFKLHDHLTATPAQFRYRILWNHYSYWFDKNPPDIDPHEFNREWVLREKEDGPYANAAVDMYVWGCALALTLALYEPNFVLLRSDSCYWEDFDRFAKEELIPSYQGKGFNAMFRKALSVGLYEGLSEVDYLNRVAPMFPEGFKLSEKVA